MILNSIDRLFNNLVIERNNAVLQELVESLFKDIAIIILKYCSGNINKILKLFKLNGINCDNLKYIFCNYKHYQNYNCEKCKNNYITNNFYLFNDLYSDLPILSKIILEIAFEISYYILNNSLKKNNKLFIDLINSESTLLNNIVLKFEEIKFKYMNDIKSFLVLFIKKMDLIDGITFDLLRRVAYEAMILQQSKKLIKQCKKHLITRSLNKNYDIIYDYLINYAHYIDNIYDINNKNNVTLKYQNELIGFAIDYLYYHSKELEIYFFYK